MRLTAAFGTAMMLLLSLSCHDGEKARMAATPAGATGDGNGSSWTLADHPCPAVFRSKATERAPWDLEIVGEPQDPDHWENKPNHDMDPGARAHFLKALQADQKSDLAGCIDENRSGLAIDLQAPSLLHLASCEARSAKLTDALRHARQALSLGISMQDRAVVKVARDRVRELAERMGELQLVHGSSSEITILALDDVALPGAPDVPSEPLPLDPGEHELTYCGKTNGTAIAEILRFSVKERELVTIRTP